jgi:hypothetical protein
MAANLGGGRQTQEVMVCHYESSSTASPTTKMHGRLRLFLFSNADGLKAFVLSGVEVNSPGLSDCRVFVRPQ